MMRGPQLEMGAELGRFLQCQSALQFVLRANASGQGQRRICWRHWAEFAGILHFLTDNAGLRRAANFTISQSRRTEQQE